MDGLEIIFDKPAAEWNEALPLGNGTMGAMSYGRFQNEKIELNLDTLWSGNGRYKENMNAHADLEFLRKKVLAGEYQDAEDYCRENILGDWTESYLPAGNLNIDVKVPELSENGNYERRLLLNKAIEKIEFRQDGQLYQREFLVSAAEPVMALHYHTDAEHCLKMVLSLESEIQYQCSPFKDNGMIMEGQAPVYVAPPYYSCDEPIIYKKGQGIRFAIGIYVQTDNGYIYQKENKLYVNAYKDIFLYLSGLTDFEQKESYLFRKEQMLKTIQHFRYKDVKTAHLKEYVKYFNRTSLTLEDTKSNNLVLKMFYYARYLMISSSLPGSQCTNLQGIWNHSMRAPWSSNYTVNINTEMNYWMAEKANLRECHEPLFQLIERTAKRGEKTAKDLYHLNGWVSHHNLDIWGHSSPVGYFGQDENPCTYSMWPMSSGWLCCHLWAHYCYTTDKKFLKDRAFPLIKGAVEFYLEYLVPYKGYLITVPSTSPENTFISPDHTVHSITIASTMDISILKELFEIYLKACEVLNITDLTDKVKETVRKLPPWKIGREGQLQEWFYDYEEADVNHRHISHLYGLYPGNLIHRENTDLLDACRMVLERRGDEGTGWCIAWKACLWARLGDGNRALKLLKKQLRITHMEECSLTGGGIYPNMLCAHPPFQIDGNFGFAAAVLEMLVQYEENKILLLPALPDEWETGEISGVKAPGDIVIGFKWENRCVMEISLKSSYNIERIVICNGHEKIIVLAANRIHKLVEGENGRWKEQKI